MQSAITVSPQVLDPVAVVSTRLDPLERQTQYLDTPGVSDRDPDLFTPPTALEAVASPCQTFRHSGWAGCRQRVYDALMETEQTEGRCRRFATCGDDCWVLQSKTEAGKYGLACNACNDRFCVPCARARARVINHNLSTRLGKEPMRFVTLTVRTDGLTLKEGLAKLYDSWKQLQRRTVWSRAVKAGVAFLELKRSADGLRWHPHFHVLTTGSYIPKIKLQEAWREITTDSFIVDIRFVRAAAVVQHYVAKYASKPLPTDVLYAHEWLCEAIVALKGKRMIIPFGDWHGLKLTERPKADEWEVLGSLHVYGVRACNGDRNAETIVRLLLKGQADAFLARVRARPLKRAESPPPAVDQLTFDLGPEEWSSACLRN